MTLLQLNRDIQHLSNRVNRARASGEDSVSLQFELDAATSEYKKLLVAQQKEDREIQEIVQELEIESILEG